MKKLVILCFISLLIWSCGRLPSLVNEENVFRFNHVIAQADSNYSLTMGELFERIRESSLQEHGGTIAGPELELFRDSVVCDSLIGFEALTVRLEEHYDQRRLYKIRYYDVAIRAYLDREVYGKVTADSQEVVDYYNSRPDLFAVKEMVNLYHILITAKGLLVGPDSVAHKKLSTEELEKAAEDHARKVRGEIESAEGFEQAARKYSDDAVTGRLGGYVGWTQRGVYKHPFDSIAFLMRDGDISAPYQDGDGWHIIYCGKYFADGIPPLDSVFYKSAMSTLKTEISNTIGKALVDSLFADMDVVFNDTILAKDPYLTDRQAWYAHVNHGRDTIDGSEVQNIEVNYRDRYHVTNTTPEMKREMLTLLARKYRLMQAARESGVENQPTVAAEEKSLRHKYSREVAKKRLDDPSWYPPDTMVESYYKAHSQEYTVDKPLVVQHIVSEDSVFAEFLRDQATSGVDFMELARQYYPGEPLIREELADLGRIGKGDIPDPFYEAAMLTQVGDISLPVKTEFGYHIIKVIEKNLSQDIGQVRPQIAAILRKQYRQGLYESFKQEAFIRYHVSFPRQLFDVHLKPLKERRSKPNDDHTG